MAPGCTATSQTALHRWASPDAAVVVVGHSIGGWAALCLADAMSWGRDGRLLDVPREPRVSRLVLYAPAAGWFAAPTTVPSTVTGSSPTSRRRPWSSPPR